MLVNRLDLIDCDISRSTNQPIDRSIPPPSNKTTGQLLVEYYLKEYGVTGFKWAIAGRSQAKLEGVKQALVPKFSDAAVRMYEGTVVSCLWIDGVNIGGVCSKETRVAQPTSCHPHPKSREQKIPTLLADSNDEAALNALTKRTKVVVTTVGPYAKVCEKGAGIDGFDWDTLDQASLKTTVT